jgi:sortase (surface protein transpeptidase)
MATPGDRGVAVLVGHVDSARDGPAVFYHLAELKPGDPVSVLRSDGRRARFVVAAVREYPKTNFPAGQVYADVDRPELRLITCGGDFDQAMGSYRDSIVVYAVGRTPPA